MESKKPLELVENRLKHFPGLDVILDMYSEKAFGKSFIKLLVEDPESAYKVLAYILNNEETAKIILSYIREPLHTHASSSTGKRGYLIPPSP